MARQRLILIHGRSTKPCQASFAELQRRSLLEGLTRVDPKKAALVEDGTIAVDFVYYGDINNAIMSEADEKADAALTDVDPAHLNARCLPVDHVHRALDELHLFRRFDRQAYRQVLIEFGDMRFLDDAARALSVLARLTKTTVLNMASIKLKAPDMGAYLTEQPTGQAIRDRLRGPLEKALSNEEDICLISHSMGGMVTYDVFWDLAHDPEFERLRTGSRAITQWITLGCPLGDAGIQAHLCGADHREDKRYPPGMVGTWHNVSAVDDFICHDRTMADDFKKMVVQSYVAAIEDHTIYNCYVDKKKSNPHKLFGYLVHPTVSRLVTDWIG